MNNRNNKKKGNETFPLIHLNSTDKLVMKRGIEKK